MSNHITHTHDDIFYNHQLSGLGEILSAYNYVVDLEIKTFSIHYPISIFTLAMLQQIYPNLNEVDGTFHPINFEDIRTELNEDVFSIKANFPYDERYCITGSQVLFWSIIKEALNGSFPTEHCYIYKQHWPSLSSWQFFFILINGSRGLSLGVNVAM